MLRVLSSRFRACYGVARVHLARSRRVFGYAGGLAVGSVMFHAAVGLHTSAVPPDIQEVLKKNEVSVVTPPAAMQKNVVQSYHTNWIAANSPCEDRSTEQAIMLGGPDSPGFHFFGMYDGHAGSAAAIFCKEQLHQFVYHAAFLQTLNSKGQSSSSGDNGAEVANILHNAFQLADLTFLVTRSALEGTMQGIMDVVSGACTLVALVDGAKLHVANAGDCRAVMCSVDCHRQVKVTQLSRDMTAEDEEEAERLRKEHPNEKDVVQNGRVKGHLQPSRGIGDGLYKLQQLAEMFTVPEGWNAPYTTAVPEVRTYPLTSDNMFVVIATDGLWDIFSNEEVCSLVLEHEYLKQTGADTDDNVSTFILRRLLTAVGRGAAGEQEVLSDEQAIQRALQLPDRRNFYDDTTVTVVFLKVPENTDAISESESRLCTYGAGHSDAPKGLKETLDYLAKQQNNSSDQK